jgi:hypothetical protein
MANLANFAAIGTIGTAAATVDVLSGVNIAQTTPFIAVTLPAPTNLTAGRIFRVSNTGTVYLIAEDVPIAPESYADLLWNGTLWSYVTTIIPDFWRSGGGTAIADGVADLTDDIAHQGRVAVGRSANLVPIADLDVGGSTLLRTDTVTNFAANGAIGTAAATVDFRSGMVIPQTTAGIALTIPAPTNATAGRIFRIANTGTAQFTAGGFAVPASGYIDLLWNGTAWVNTPTGTNLFRVVQALVVGPNVITHNLGQSAVMVEVRDNVTGADIAVAVTGETTTTTTINVSLAVAAARISIRA